MEKQVDNFINSINLDLIWKNQMLKDVLYAKKKSRKNQIEAGISIEKKDSVPPNVLESIQKEEELLNARIVENLSLEANPISKNTFIVLTDVKRKNAISKQNVKFVVKKLSNEEVKLKNQNTFIVE